MDKILLIIGREYWVRVKKKSFLIVTFLVPLLIAGMYGLIFYLMLNQTKLETPKKIQVIDPSNLFSKDLKNTEKIQFSPALKQDLLETEKNFKKENIDFILFIPPIKDIALGAMDGEALTPKGIQLIGDKEASIGILGSINDQLEKILRNRSYIEAGIDTAKMNRIKPNVQISTSILTETGEKKSNSFSSYGIGFISSLLIYILVLVYGVQVMRGVMEEKTSRVVEVIISSVRPFQLMMGKIIGVALVGLTQFILWITVSAIATPLVLSQFQAPKTSSVISTSTGFSSNITKKVRVISTNNQAAAPNSDLKAVIDALGTQNYPYLLSCFLFYFLSGYLLYSALFAAVGAAVDSETETQQFMFPITMPLVFAFIFSVNYVVNNPDSSLSVWLSMVPFFAPIVMMVRVPFHPPLWQLLLSMALMILGFIGTVWAAGRIYRTGILMYGKKVNFAELGKWLFYRQG